jgi:enoyl-[acyl-carrier-protein] reductase (NADH)
MTPLGRLGHPEDIAAVVVYLAGPDASWLTGQNIRADGGLDLTRPHSRSCTPTTREPREAGQGGG